jgi:ornithine cyclodeaminase
MRIINEADIRQIGIDWNSTTNVVLEAIKCMDEGDFAQPVKPYLRYRNVKNRIIAMPAFVGGEINMAGIKWIASFPDNIRRHLPRAHCVVILNDPETGEPLAIICTPLISIIRTVSVSGLFIRYFDDCRKLDNVKIGIAGFGPIGQYHLKMCLSLLGDAIKYVRIYDTREIDRSLIEDVSGIVEIVDSWEDAYLDADIFFTCTVADAPYIDKPPKQGSLHMNISLRDYKTDVFKWFKDAIIVDDWDEVCRERTDVEVMHLENGLRREDTRSIIEVIRHGGLSAYDPTHPVLFNPMGMAVFDIAIGTFYYNQTKSNCRE